MSKIQILFLGAPGSGKGTQSEKITEEFGVIQISTGDMLREAVKNGTELGVIAKAFMDEGSLVTDDIIIKMMKERLSAPDCQKGFILDGFPRTVTQATALDTMLQTSLDCCLTHVISLEVPDEPIVERLSGRRVSPLTGKAYHVKFNPPAVNGMSEDGKTPLIHRDDDKPETIVKRLEVFHSQADTLKSYYKPSGKLHIVDGSRNPESVYEDIRKILS